MRDGVVDETANDAICAAAVVGTAGDRLPLLLLAYEVMDEVTDMTACDPMDNA